MAAAAGDEEGRSFDRVVAFSDGVFAIAITLLVLSFHLPHVVGDHQGTKLLHDLLDQGDLLVGFAVSFFVVARYWLSHHELSRVLRGVDAKFIVLNFFFLAFIVFVPYPAEVLGVYGNTTTAVVFYAGTLCITSLLAAALWEYGFRARLIRAKNPAALQRHTRLRSAVPFLVFLTSIPIAFVDADAAKLWWLLLAGQQVILTRVGVPDRD